MARTKAELATPMIRRGSLCKVWFGDDMLGEEPVKLNWALRLVAIVQYFKIPYSKEMGLTQGRKGLFFGCHACFSFFLHHQVVLNQIQRYFWLLVLFIYTDCALLIPSLQLSKPPSLSLACPSHNNSFIFLGFFILFFLPTIVMTRCQKKKKKTKLIQLARNENLTTERLCENYKCQWTDPTAKAAGLDAKIIRNCAVLNFLRNSK